MVKQYEVMVLLPANSTPEQVKSFISQIEKLVSSKQGSVVSHEMLGKRNLAYEIKKQREAYYVLFVISVDTSAIQAIERSIRLMDGVMRHLVILYEEKTYPDQDQTSSATVEEGTSEA